MSENWQQGIHTLLRKSSVSFLATQGSDGPETSMAPYAVFNGLILLHLSSLAKHRHNIEQNSHIGLMICSPESELVSPLSLPRLSMQGDITDVCEERFVVAKEAYLKKIPDAEPLFGFADFRLFEFTPKQINWVGGFGKARMVSSMQWQELSRSN